MEKWNEFIGQMEANNVARFAITAFILIAFMATRWLMRKSLRRLACKFSYDPNRVAATKRIISILLYSITIIILIIVWGGDLNNLWVSLGSILGLIAIGFFAIWSILSNIISGIIIYTINPFKISDTIVLVEKEITGKVTDIGLIFTTLSDDEGSFTVPNNLFFQQVVKVKRKA